MSDAEKPEKAVSETATKLLSVKLTEKHRHAGKECNVGDVIQVDKDAMDFIVANKRGVVIK